MVDKGKTNTKLVALIIVLILISGIAVYNTYNTIIQDQKINDKEKEINDLNQNITNLRKDLHYLNKDYDNLQSELTSLEKDYSDLSEKFNKLSANYNALNNDYLNLTEDYNFLVSLFNRDKIIYRSYFVEYYWEYPENYSKTGIVEFNETLSTYYEYSIKNHTTSRYAESFQKFITPEHPTISKIANDVDTSYSKDIDKANALLDIVSTLEYKYDVLHPDNEEDPNADEDPKYPIETIIDGTGDCEDLSFLYASLCKVIGLDVVLLEWVNIDSNSKHINVGINLPEIPPDSNDLKYIHAGQEIYYVCECTGDSVTWDVGSYFTGYNMVRDIEID